jgi:hypothetical protein
MIDSQTKIYAGFWQRVGAFALDYIIILLYLVAITLLSFLMNSLFSVNQWLFSDRIRAQVTGFLFITLPVSLYSTGHLGKTAAETESHRPEHKPDQFLEIGCPHVIEIHSVGISSHPHLADFLHAQSIFAIDYRRLWHRLPFDWSKYCFFGFSQRRPNAV